MENKSKQEIERELESFRTSLNELEMNGDFEAFKKLYDDYAKLNTYYVRNF